MVNRYLTFQVVAGNYNQPIYLFYYALTDFYLILLLFAAKIELHYFTTNSKKFYLRSPFRTIPTEPRTKKWPPHRGHFFLPFPQSNTKRKPSRRMA